MPFIPFYTISPSDHPRPAHHMWGSAGHAEAAGRCAGPSAPEPACHGAGATATGRGWVGAVVGSLGCLVGVGLVEVGWLGLGLGWGRVSWLVELVRYFRWGFGLATQPETCRRTIEWAQWCGAEMIMVHGSQMFLFNDLVPKSFFLQIVKGRANSSTDDIHEGW